MPRAFLIEEYGRCNDSDGDYFTDKEKKLFLFPHGFEQGKLVQLFRVDDSEEGNGRYGWAKFTQEYQLAEGTIESVEGEKLKVAWLASVRREDEGRKEGGKQGTWSKADVPSASVNMTLGKWLNGSREIEGSWQEDHSGDLGAPKEAWELLRTLTPGVEAGGAGAKDIKTEPEPPKSGGCKAFLVEESGRCNDSDGDYFTDTEKKAYLFPDGFEEGKLVQLFRDDDSEEGNGRYGWAKFTREYMLAEGTVDCVEENKMKVAWTVAVIKKDCDGKEGVWRKHYDVPYPSVDMTVGPWKNGDRKIEGRWQEEHSCDVPKEALELLKTLTSAFIVSLSGCTEKEGGGCLALLNMLSGEEIKLECGAGCTVRELSELLRKKRNLGQLQEIKVLGKGGAQLPPEAEVRL